MIVGLDNRTVAERMVNALPSLLLPVPTFLGTVTISLPFCLQFEDACVSFLTCFSENEDVLLFIFFHLLIVLLNFVIPENKIYFSFDTSLRYST